MVDSLFCIHWLVLGVRLVFEGYTHRQIVEQVLLCRLDFREHDRGSMIERAMIYLLP